MVPALKAARGYACPQVERRTFFRASFRIERRPSDFAGTVPATHYDLRLALGSSSILLGHD